MMLNNPNIEIKYEEDSEVSLLENIDALDNLTSFEEKFAGKSKSR